MKTATKVSAYGLALAIVFGGAWAAGAAAGPVGGTSAPTGHDHSAAAQGHEGMNDQPTGDIPPGLSVSQHGYTLNLDSNEATPGTQQQFRFHITGPDSKPVTRYAVEHDKRLHFVVARRDGSGYQHLHPELAEDGTWSVPLTLPAAGSYRVFADFTPEGGPQTTLGADIQAPGAYEPQQHRAGTRVSTVDGYTVRLDGDLTTGKPSSVTATVTRDGQPVRDLQPYLGAYGHLVALRSADLAYLHVHPQGQPGDGVTAAGPAIGFAVEVPTAGQYRLFLDFQHDGQVRTAEFTLDAS
ncbi:hypothetical protein F0L68_18640 [Solihabitans fulvus]|uniref:Secreted protein n=1 Tax=Solihabitans fulvus TaxID=1892852 RepID=A0A5B2XDG6_9PSEU|nr:hypothetical protein [Solihabitans fulvus]KAA2261079.1 hypothetical protein F0L68_18640 [Solihabitans fulvus]